MKRRKRKKFKVPKRRAYFWEERAAIMCLKLPVFTFVR